MSTMVSSTTVLAAALVVAVLPCVLPHHQGSKEAEGKAAADLLLLRVLVADLTSLLSP